MTEVELPDRIPDVTAADRDRALQITGLGGVGDGNPAAARAIGDRM